MYRPLRPIRPVRVSRPAGAPLVRGLVAGGAAYTAARGALPPAGEPDPVDRLARLAQLGGMVQQGLLTPEEFAAAKARLLH